MRAQKAFSNLLYFGQAAFCKAACKTCLTMKTILTCVHPEGRFVWGIHKPSFQVVNLRRNDFLAPVGYLDDKPLMNNLNFPAGDVEVPLADWIYEIANPFAFRGTTYIGKKWADAKTVEPAEIKIEPAAEASLYKSLENALGDLATVELMDRIYRLLPEPLQLALAATSSDKRDLVKLAEIACFFQAKPAKDGQKTLAFLHGPDDKPRANISDHILFETVANNPFLPDEYKLAMVLRPGVQGNSEIVGEWSEGSSHVFEYLRSNSYIPWGHFAANMAHDSIRYSIGELQAGDMRGMRHLYYQRTYLRLAESLDIQVDVRRRNLGLDELDRLREKIETYLSDPDRASRLPFKATLWGWNYGFDFAPSGYRLHASHQQIHQQYAMIRARVPGANKVGQQLKSYACGDLVQDFVSRYRRMTGKSFFKTYFKAISTNQRTDGRRDLAADLVIHSDKNVMLMVPKAQTSQWELQLVCRRQVGNIVEADTKVRQSLDRGLFLAMKILSAMGARMITVLEYSRPFQAEEHDQHLFYVFLPRLPQSPGAFSEAQLRWINGHYPEDFARACRRHLEQALNSWQG